MADRNHELDMLAKAGIVGEDAETLLTAFDPLNISSETIRVASVFEANGYTRQE